MISPNDNSYNNDNKNIQFFPLVPLKEPHYGTRQWAEAAARAGANKSWDSEPWGDLNPIATAA